MWTNDKGGYDYAVQRLSDLRYIADAAKHPLLSKYPGIIWTYDPQEAATADVMNEDDDEDGLLTNTVGERLFDLEELLVSPDALENQPDWHEEDAWAVSQRVLKPEYRLVRIPFVDYELMVADENGDPYGDDSSDEEDLGPFWIDEDTPNWTAIRTYVFGENGAIAGEREYVPTDAPWASCSDDEFMARFMDMDACRLIQHFRYGGEYDPNDPRLEEYQRDPNYLPTILDKEYQDGLRRWGVSEESIQQQIEQYLAEHPEAAARR